MGVRNVLSQTCVYRPAFPIGAGSSALKEDEWQTSKDVAHTRDTGKVEWTLQRGFSGCIRNGASHPKTKRVPYASQGLDQNSAILEASSELRQTGHHERYRRYSLFAKLLKDSPRCSY